MHQRTARERQSSTPLRGPLQAAHVRIEGSAPNRHSLDSGEEVVPLGLYWPIKPLVCGNFVSIRSAQRCFVVTNATDAPRRVYGNINRNKALQVADFGILPPDQICKPLVGGSSPSAGTN